MLKLWLVFLPNWTRGCGLFAAVSDGILSFPPFTEQCRPDYESNQQDATFSLALLPNAGHSLLIFEISRSHTTTHHSR